MRKSKWEGKKKAPIAVSKRGNVKRTIINLESTLIKKLQLFAACIQET